MPRQLIGDSRPTEPIILGHPEHVDDEYVRNGTDNVLMAVELLRGWRMTEVLQTNTTKDWALFTEKSALTFPDAEKIIFPEDNLNTHKAASWDEVFPPAKAAWLMNRYTPKHGSWFNITESA